MATKWTAAILDRAIDCLSTSRTIEEACVTLRNEYQITFANPNSLERALRRHRGKAPVDYLGTSLHDEDVDLYRFEYNGTEFTLEEAQLQHILFMYAAKKVGGLSKPANEVASEMHNNGWLPAHLDHKAVLAIFKELGVRKNSPPATPFQLRSFSEENIATSYRLRYEAYTLSQDGKEAELANLKSIIRRLRTEVNEARNIRKLSEELNISEPVKAVTYDEDCASVLLIPIADIHVGAKFESQPHTRQYDSYNSKVVDHRVAQIIGHIQELDDLKSRDTVHLAFLGDNFEALLANMRPGQCQTMDNFGYQQFFKLQEHLRSICVATCEKFPNSKIKIVFQGGNHDRVTPERSYNSEDVVNAILAGNIAMLLAEYDNVEVITGAATTSIMHGNGVNIISKHGHKGGLRSNDAAIAKVVQTHGLDHALRRVYVQGHYHSFKMSYAYNCLAMTVPSVCGNTDYNLDYMDVASDPQFIALKLTPRKTYVYGPFLLDSDV